MFESVKSKFLDYVDYPEDQITESTEIIKDLQMNSFDIITLLGELESEYGISFAQEDIDGISTIGDLVACIKGKL
ncbi:MAG: phosphopantetheine-binding protein [Clostridia bacterium]|nr:phosphopantetheine-binding protein [Clostridia bacterium]